MNKYINLYMFYLIIEHVQEKAENQVNNILFHHIKYMAQYLYNTYHIPVVETVKTQCMCEYKLNLNITIYIYKSSNKFYLKKLPFWKRLFKKYNITAIKILDKQIYLDNICIEKENAKKILIYY